MESKTVNSFARYSLERHVPVRLIPIKNNTLVLPATDYIPVYRNRVRTIDRNLNHP